VGANVLTRIAMAPARDVGPAAGGFAPYDRLCPCALGVVGKSRKFQDKFRSSGCARAAPRITFA